ncbi:MAG: hypothetical protein AAGD25_39010 [Cyanobacteria bacterium P01_F01_bin.150]
MPSEDGDASDPDDNATGGTIRFDLASPQDINSIGLLDIDESATAVIKAISANGSMDEVSIDPAGDNQFQTVALGFEDVSILEVTFSASGAVTNLNLDSSAGEGITDGLDIGLYDAQTDALIQILEEGDTLLASSIRDLNDVNIGALIPSDSSFFGQVESMQVLLNGSAATDYFENVAPYALFGDTLGDYFQGALAQGDNTVTFELYAKNNGQGDLIGTVERNFTIA